MIKKLILAGVIALAPISLFAKKEALIVAVGKYKERSIKTLHVGYDISKMKYLLEKRGFNVTILQNRHATYHNVVKYLKYYKNLSSNDTFVFYNTSHGVQVPDLNGDETDGQDEAFALYDVTLNNSSIHDTKGLLVDDELDFLLSKISAKKLMITDACHSGSIHKGFSSSHYTTKNLSRSLNFKNSNRALFRKKQNYNVKNLVVLSASKDNQLSIDTASDGGLFTSTLYHVWEKNPNINFKDLANKTSEIIRNKRYNNITPQQPQVYSTNNEEGMEINLYLQDVEGYLDMAVRKSKNNSINIYSKYPKYKVNDNISFKIDTHNHKGYIYILNVGEKKIVKMFPNQYHKSSKISSKIFYFPSNKFDIQANISNERKSQRTVAYAILSDRPINLLEQNRELSSKILKKIFGNPNNKNWLNTMFSSNISVAKCEFLVVK